MPEVGAQWVQGAGATAFGSADVPPRCSSCSCSALTTVGAGSLQSSGLMGPDSGGHPLSQAAGSPCQQMGGFPGCQSLPKPSTLAHRSWKKMQRVASACLAVIGVRVGSHQEHELTPFLRLFPSLTTISGHSVMGWRWPGAPTGCPLLATQPRLPTRAGSAAGPHPNPPLCQGLCRVPVPCSGEYGLYSSCSRVALRMRTFIAKIGNLALPQGTRKGNYCFIPRVAFVRVALCKGRAVQPTAYNVVVKNCPVGILFFFFCPGNQHRAATWVPGQGLGAPLCE